MPKIKGAYTLKVIEAGEILKSLYIPNIITTVGQIRLGRFITNETDLFIEYFGVGVGSTAAVVGNTDLVHEIFRTSVESKSFSIPVANSVLMSFNTTLGPNQGLGKIAEIGTFDSLREDNQSANENLLIGGFDLSQDIATDGTSWTQGTNDTTQFIEGESSLFVPFTNGLATTLGINLDLSYLSTFDKFQFWAYPASVANLTNLRLRFSTDAANYYEKTFTGLSATTWNLLSAQKTTFTPTGTPDWSNITSVSVITTISSGTININLDSLRIVPSLSSSNMFSRAVISPAITKTSKQELLITYDLSFGF